MKATLKEGDAQAIKAAMEDLNQCMQKIGESMQQAAGGAQPGAEAAAGAQQQSSQKADDHIEDAEVEIVDSDKDDKKE